MNVLSCGLLWAKSIKHFGDYGRHFPLATHKNPRSKGVHVPQAMAQFVLKIEKLSHIMGTASMVELARAYGLHSRLWLLIHNIKKRAPHNNNNNNNWVAVGEPSHKMGTGCLLRRKMTKLRNLYPEGIVCVQRFRCLCASFRTIEESILGVLEAV